MGQKKVIPPIYWKPDKTDALPLYTQIVRFICDRVAAGDWTIGMQLPSQRELASCFGVNRSTIVTAMNELTGDGILETGQGAGTKVSSNTWSLLSRQSVDWSAYMSAGPFKANIPPIQAIAKYEADADMIRLGTGELSPDLFPRQFWQKALTKSAAAITSLGYVEPLGMLPLREALSAYMRTKGMGVPPSCILITSGSLQALQLISVSMLRPGSTIYTEAPTYLKSLQLFQSAGLYLEGLPLDTEGLQYWRMPSLSLNDQNRRSILYTIPTNHNPTGISMSNQRRQDLIEFCTLRRLPIIEDDAYGPLYFGPETLRPLKAYDQNGVVIYLGTTSKSLAAGLRIGWLAAPESVVQRLGDVKMQMDYGASSLSQWVFAEFLTSGMYEDYTKFLQKELLRRRDNALRALEKYFSDIASWNRPMGGFYIWVTLKEKLPMDVLFHRAAQKGLLLNPGDMYDFNPNHSLRISYSYVSCDTFTQGLERLSQLIRSMKKT